MNTELPALHLRRREERRVRHGHPWVFSNEVDVQRSPLTEFSAGDQVMVYAHGGRPLGVAYVNPRTLICARLFANDPAARLDQALLATRVNAALRLRERLFDRPFYRLVFGESDDLPGLIVDRYDDVLVAQIGTAGMERLREPLAEVLLGLAGVATLVFRNDAPVRELEGLPAYVETLGAPPPPMLRVEENGARFELPLTDGQKTGWFYDHRPNRTALARYVRGLSVLDMFSYAGGFGVQAACAGAGEVLCVDSSASALALASDNAARNGVEATLGTEQGDAFEVLKALRNASRRFDVVVLDPPAFIRRKKDMAAGQEAYRRINRLAMNVLAADGILLTASCSSHLRRERLLELVQSAAEQGSRTLRVLEQGHQGADHPVHPGLPETDYLKSFLCRVTL